MSGEDTLYRRALMAALAGQLIAKPANRKSQ